jgi:hypothetical protein
MLKKDENLRLFPVFVEYRQTTNIGKWKQHIHCRQNQQVRGQQGGGAEALT